MSRMLKTFYKLVLHAMYMAWNLSKPASTPAPATPRRIFAPAPFIRDMKPSFLVTWMKQSIEPLYLTPPPEVIIILLLTVSEDKHVKKQVSQFCCFKDTHDRAIEI